MIAIASAIVDGQVTGGTYTSSERRGSLTSNRYGSWNTLNRYFLSKLPDGEYLVKVYHDHEYDSYGSPHSEYFYSRLNGTVHKEPYDYYVSRHKAPFCFLGQGDTFTMIYRFGDPSYRPGTWCKITPRHATDGDRVVNAVKEGSEPDDPDGQIYVCIHLIVIRRPDALD